MTSLSSDPFPRHRPEELVFERRHLGGIRLECVCRGGVLTTLGAQNMAETPAFIRPDLLIRPGGRVRLRPGRTAVAGRRWAQGPDVVLMSPSTLVHDSHRVIESLLDDGRGRPWRRQRAIPGDHQASASTVEDVEQSAGPEAFR
jgi:hypothetical protein